MPYVNSRREFIRLKIQTYQSTNIIPSNPLGSSFVTKRKITKAQGRSVVTSIPYNNTISGRSVYKPRR